jgi:sigma-E factor negative regulatory protein RseB
VVQLLIALLILFAAAGQADDVQLNAKQILQRMVNAMEVSDYQGTVVFLKNGNLEAMKYFHTFEDNHGRERLVSVNSPQREIVRKSSEVSCLFKATKRRVVDQMPYQHSFIVDVPKNLDNLDVNYQFEIVGEEDVAMQSAYIVAIQPKDELRYVRKIWVTKTQFLPIKAAIYDLAGEVLEQVVFTDINVKTIAPLVSLANNPGLQSSDAKAIIPITPPPFSMGKLPEGFRHVFSSREPIHESAQPVDHIILSDGFASVSIYLESKAQEPYEGLHLPEGIHSVGAINSISRTLADSQVTVLGEVPAATVKMIAEGIELHPAAQ